MVDVPANAGQPPGPARATRPRLDGAPPAGIIAAKIRVPRFSGLTRERLTTLLANLRAYRVGVVVAPAGSGKTTLLAEFASTASVPVAWYRA
ncbi:MAG: hypothetical protein ACRD0M_07705, partial [Acidimicrobiales bacterium]